ncbi:hypothetical protein ACFX2B_020101 [Malus domestica]
MCADEDVGPLRGWIVTSHINQGSGSSKPYMYIPISTYHEAFWELIGFRFHQNSEVKSEKRLRSIVSEVHEFVKAIIREKKRDLSKAKAFESVDLLPGFLSFGRTDKKNHEWRTRASGSSVV